MDSNIKVISVSHIFKDTSYVIPIYQRNYAWGESEIQQLIDDIDSAIDDSNKNYFLGNLIVNQIDHHVYEVIDGQQRLTTLFLLGKYLGHDMIIGKDALRFEAREKANRTLKRIGKDGNDELLEELEAVEILEGYEIIKNYLESHVKDKKVLLSKLKNVYLIRVQVPKGIDLNHYFEIMNTRGEQLELHEIAKAKFLEVLETEEDKKTGALIWEKCSNMNSYIQMNFDPEIRKALFTDDWSSLENFHNDHFDSVKKCVANNIEENQSNLLIEILQNKKRLKENEKEEKVERNRFESIISFPNFLLQVNAVMKELGEEDTSLDDKHFLRNLSWAWKDASSAKKFLCYMLKCRVLFDKYVLKREFTSDEEKGAWSLQRLKYHNNHTSYISTFSDDDRNHHLIKTLQSCLRVTYTSPKTMHWITLVLKNVLKDEACNILTILEDYCKRKVKKVMKLDAEGVNGLKYQRIIFTYLDYLLYKNGYQYNGKEIIKPMNDKWEFQFRSSIEHFYPQNPLESQKWEKGDLDSFGNLALITVSGNSKFSNLSPESKISSYPSIINQSLKLIIMKELVEMNGRTWTVEKAREHKEEMFKILNES